MTADYARGQPASAWPLAGQPCKVDCDLHTIARAHNKIFFVRPIGTLGLGVAAVEYLIMCTPIMHRAPSKLMPKWHFFLYFYPARSLHDATAVSTVSTDGWAVDARARELQADPEGFDGVLPLKIVVPNVGFR